MAFAAGDAGMPLFLFIAGIFNLLFIVRAVKDLRSRGHAMSGSPAAAMLLTALSELCWVLPCFVQCFLVFVLGGDGDWAPILGRFGCDFQGFYSVLGSVAGMLSSMLLAVFTMLLADTASRDGIAQALPSPRATGYISAAIFLFAVLVALLPVVATGGYVETGDGFCYTDWYEPGQSVIMFLVTFPTFFGTIALYVRVLARGTWPNRRDIVLLLASFVSAWFLWIPASFMGWANVSFPRGFMLTGGILGHAQALINPYLYGIRWRDSLQLLGGVQQLSADKPKAADEAAMPDMHVPATPASPPSLPPSPPASQSLPPSPPTSERAATPPPADARVAWEA